MKGNRARGNGPVLYDFRRPTKLSREHVRTLQMAYESFARMYGTLLSSKLRVVSQVSLIAIEQLTYAEYLEQLENPTVLALIELEPLPGVSIFEFSLSTALASVDHLLGGPGGPQPQRTLTDIETPLIHSLLEQILSEFKTAFEPIAEIRPRLTRVEYNPQFVQASSASEAMIVASFEMRVGSEDCVATICMPFGSIFTKLQGESAGSSLTDVQRTAREQAHRNMAANLHSTPIDVSVRFESIRMAPSDLIALQPGDIVQLNHSVTTPLAVSSAGITFAHAVPGSAGKRLACLVVPPPQEENR